MGGVDILKSQEWLAAILLMQNVDKELSRAIRQYTKAMAEPEWKAAVSKRSSSRLERRVISGTTEVRVSNANLRVRSGGKGRPLSGGLTMAQAAPAVEFGSKRFKQFGPRRKAGPFYRSAKEMVPRLAALWVQTTMKTLALALNGER